MLIPRFLLKHTAILYKKLGINGMGDPIIEPSWTKKCYVTTKTVKREINGGYTQEIQFTILIESLEISIGDILNVDGVDVEIVEIPPLLDPRSRYMEVIGYGKKE